MAGVQADPDVPAEHGLGLGRAASQQPPGMVRFSWDGVDSSGKRADSGQYQVSARVIRGTNIESAPTVIEAEIQSVTLGQFGGGLTLNLAGGQQMPLGQIYQIIG